MLLKSEVMNPADAVSAARPLNPSFSAHTGQRDVTVLRTFFSIGNPEKHIKILSKVTGTSPTEHKQTLNRAKRPKDP